MSIEILNPELVQRLHDILGQAITDVRTVQGGYTPALRLVVSLQNGGSVFAKIATTLPTAVWLRREHRIYQSLSGPFMPTYLGWHDDGQTPILVLEDLSAGFWPPPWTDARVQLVCQSLASIRSTIIEGLPALSESSDLGQGWARVAKAPAPFLSLGLTSEHWLHLALPRLLAASEAADLGGSALLHLDVRSDNICFFHNHAILVDWNWACTGNPDLDLAFWLPSLEIEGGPLPETLLPAAPEMAAVVSGFFASQAGLTPIPDAPHVRTIQLAQLRSALPWAVRALGLIELVQ